MGHGRDGRAVGAVARAATRAQVEAPYFTAWQAFQEQQLVSFSVPGHKQGRGAPPELAKVFGAQALALDIPHAGGVDDTHLTAETLRQAEQLAAEAWGADDALFLVNGSTTGNVAAMLALARPGRPLIVTRALHKSLLAGLILSGARPVYLTPALHPEANLLLDMPAEVVARALAEHPDATAVMLVSPTYTGVASDLPAIAAICQQAGVPLYVDEAWGPHFAFHPALPTPAVQAGADAAVTSIHKLLGGITQAALLLCRGERVTRAHLGPCVELVQTTSPAAFLYASIDAARRRMVLEGQELLDRVLALAAEARVALAQIRGLWVHGPELIADRPGAAFDPTRILVDVQGLGITGYEAERVLRERFGVAVEMSDLVSVMFVISLGDTQETIDRLVDGMRGLAEWARAQGPASSARASAFAAFRSTGAVLTACPPALTPREAFFAPSVAVPLSEAIGRVAAEPVTPYPPGIPVIAPGELITAEAIAYLEAGRAAGMYASGPADPRLHTIRVVAE
ncbi:MAG: aminotransferase class V-fold PLP-dependent enzyme [Thermorudis peleae]|nr:aminotransferase class V-fold PLP-dependent enzyme [Thermorudis peleae]